MNPTQMKRRTPSVVPTLGMSFAHAKRVLDTMTDKELEAIENSPDHRTEGEESHAYLTRMALRRAYFKALSGL